MRTASGDPAGTTCSRGASATGSGGGAASGFTVKSSSCPTGFTVAASTDRARQRGRRRLADSANDRAMIAAA
ncbi:hypothetical protein GCM10009754_63870 [Amycolatopsis minnesotensis]|uniref:Uncharacterized protein n=1 Tax=Amycolatopsis minnesotensis TaxID=337894 RepID=A0ABN2S1R7_9PSEU